MVSGHYTQAVWFILLGVICDALDGRVARLGGRESLFGKEFDSIADIISFGVAPTLMMIFLVLTPTVEKYPFFLQISWLIGFVYLLCAAVRLARFNVLTHPMLPPAERLKGTKDFLGLPGSRCRRDDRLTGTRPQQLRITRTRDADAAVHAGHCIPYGE